LIIIANLNFSNN